MFGAPKPPAPPPPPPNPPTFAGTMAGPSSQMPSIYGGLGSTILTSPFGAPDQNAVQRKTLLGQ